MTAIRKNIGRWEAGFFAAMREGDGGFSRRTGKNGLQVISRDRPDPKTYARSVTREFAKVLASASFRSHSFHVNGCVAAKLRPYGLVEHGGNCLTAFGIKVRTALLAGDV